MLALLPMLLPLLGGILSKIIPDAGQAAQATLELQKALIERQADVDKAVADAAKAQNDVNLAEAGSASMFVAGWRPFVGWTCGAGCAYGFLAQPLLAWATGLLSVLIEASIPVPPVLDMSTLLGLLGGLLGLGTMRTVEKVQGVDRQSLKAAR